MEMFIETSQSYRKIPHSKSQTRGNWQDHRSKQVFC